ncbi:hypothetical protein FOCC_FOCC007286 [Frankliniella occidentalis]|nr:hypothetical protein FOCC_FOCC007286 [Frankliniella occidentalis]
MDIGKSSASTKILTPAQLRRKKWKNKKSSAKKRLKELAKRQQTNNQSNDTGKAYVTNSLDMEMKMSSAATATGTPEAHGQSNFTGQPNVTNSLDNGKSSAPTKTLTPAQLRRKKWKNKKNSAKKRLKELAKRQQTKD